MTTAILIVAVLMPLGQASIQKLEAINHRNQIKALDKYADSLYRRHTMGEVFKYPKTKPAPRTGRLTLGQ